jgi:hypothetical protein
VSGPSGLDSEQTRASGTDAGQSRGPGPAAPSAARQPGILRARIQTKAHWLEHGVAAPGPALTHSPSRMRIAAVIAVASLRSLSQADSDRYWTRREAPGPGSRRCLAPCPRGLFATLVRRWTPDFHHA